MGTNGGIVVVETPAPDVHAQQRQAAAQAALEFVDPGSVIGIGTGSTASQFVRELAKADVRVAGAVSSSDTTSALLHEHGIPEIDLVEVGRLSVYVDGADEADKRLRLIKGGGGALTREKIVAGSSELFVCIADESKLVPQLGAFPVAIEVIPMAITHAAYEVARLGGKAQRRAGFVTDNGNLILDVYGLDLRDPVMVEWSLDGIAGAVSNGLFARRPADVLLVGEGTGVARLEAKR